MGIILRNCRLNKTQLLATNLAKAVPVRPKLFHVEQFGFVHLRFGTIDLRATRGVAPAWVRKLHVEQFL
jgi:hypothetical protein